MGSARAMSADSRQKKCTFTCFHCSTVFNRKFSLRRHIVRIHNDNTVTNYSSLTVKKNKRLMNCPHCSFTCFNSIRLNDHLVKIHELKLHSTKVSFFCEKEFDEWKEKIEADTRSYFIIRSRKRLRNGSLVRYYRCNRSGSYSSSNTGKRMFRAKGSCKTGHYCTAQMKRCDDNGVINVMYHGTHTGHPLEMRYLHLPESVEKMIAEKIRKGISLDKILDDIRTEDISPGTIQKKHFLNKKKLYNIVHKYNLTDIVKYHDDDAVSVDKLRERYEMMETNPIIFYKKSNAQHENIPSEEIMLIVMTKEQQEMFKKFGNEKILIDSTRNTNEYELQLTSIFVLDEYGVSFPVTYCISSRVNENTMYVLFKKIKDTIGTIQPNVFMSDIAQCYYNAWKNVMTEVKNQILCKWHVDEHWRKNLSKLPNQSAKCQVYAALRILLEEPKKEEFETLLQCFLKKLDEDGFTEFKKYFERIYSRQPQLWAVCYREEEFFNTNMALETSPKVLKHVYLKSKQNNRLDLLIQILMKIIRDKTFNRMINVTEGYVSRYIDSINLRHRKATNLINVGSVNVIVEGKEWQILNVGVKNTSYNVRKIENECLCQQKCSICDVCVHKFNCTCNDYFIAHNVCKHIHAVVLFEKEKPISDSTLIDSLIITQEETIDNVIEIEEVCSELQMNSDELNFSEEDAFLNELLQLVDIWKKPDFRIKDPANLRLARKYSSEIMKIFLEEMRG